MNNLNLTKQLQIEIFFMKFIKRIFIATLCTLATGCTFHKNEMSQITPQNNVSIRTTKNLLSNYGVPPKVVVRLEAELNTMRMPSFDYPWTGLEDAVKKMPNGKLPLLGYGSLLNQNSASETIQNISSNGCPPVVALGAMGVFNYIMACTASLISSPFGAAYL